MAIFGVYVLWKHKYQCSNRVIDCSVSCSLCSVVSIAMFERSNLPEVEHRAIDRSASFQVGG